MATAPRADQLALLKVADYDSAIARLRRDDVRHPLREEVGELMNLIAAQSRDITATEDEIAVAEAELEVASKKTADLASTVTEKEARLNAGTGMDSRQLLTLQSEIETQRQILDGLTEEEFTVLERLESAQEKLATLTEGKRVLNESMVVKRSELEDAITEITADISILQSERDAIYGPLDANLKDEYDRAVKRGGLTVIKLFPNGTTSGGVELSPIEINQIKNGDPERIHISEDYGAIVVLTDRD